MLNPTSTICDPNFGNHKIKLYQAASCKTLGQVMLSGSKWSGCAGPWM